MDVCSLFINTAFVIGDLMSLELQTMRPIAAVAIFIMWMKFFYFLRLFETTAPVVRMIMQIISDMTTFSFVLTIAVLGFANTFYILALNGVDY